MKKILFILVLLSVYCFGDWLNEGQSQYDKGNYQEAIKLFKKACDGNNANDCVTLGTMHQEGQGVKQDYFKAVKLFKKACALNNVSGCYYLGFMHKKGKGTEQNEAKAKDLWKKACDGNFSLGCTMHESLNK